MSVRSERIKLLVEESNLSYQELEKKTGIKKSSLQRYASGVTSKIPLDVIEKLSAAFNVSQAYLMGWNDNEGRETATPDKVELTEGEKKWLELYSKLSSDTRDMFTDMAGAFEKLPIDTQLVLRDMFLAALNNRK